MSSKAHTISLIFLLIFNVKIIIFLLKFVYIELFFKIKVISMDLYSPFKSVIKDKFYHASIVADLLHFTRIVINSLDELRLNLWRNTKGKEKLYFKYLKHSLMKDVSKAT